MDHDTVLMHLNRLIKITEDGKEGYRLAADVVDIPQYRTMFLENAQQRALFAEQLRNEVIRLGGEPADSGSTFGPIHRAWINLRTALADKNTYSILDECRRGDEAALEEYQAVLATSMPTPLADLLGSQVEEIASTLSAIVERAEGRS